MGWFLARCHVQADWSLARSVLAFDLPLVTSFSKPRAWCLGDFAAFPRHAIRSDVTLQHD
jgi:hypothetical protein